MASWVVSGEFQSASNMAGISRLLVSRRERAVMLEPRAKVSFYGRVRYGDKVRDETTILAAFFWPAARNMIGSMSAQSERGLAPRAPTISAARWTRWGPDSRPYRSRAITWYSPSPP